MAAVDLSPAQFTVHGKTAIITGAGSGINYSFAKLLLSKGCNVLIADLTLRPEAETLLKDYSATPKCVFEKTDVTSWTQLHRMFEATVDTFGSFDIVCPGAGVFEPHWSNFWHPPGSSESKDSPTGDRYALIDLLVTHPIRTTQLALQYWLSPNPNQQTSKPSPSNPKRVIHVSSIAGQGSNMYTPMYSAGKHAINGFIRSLGPLEAELGVRVAGVAPGVIKTPLWTSHPEKMKIFDEAQDEWVMPEEVADAMFRLCVDGDLPGGTVLEVGKGSTRLVKAYMDPGPRGEGLRVSQIDKGREEVWGWLAQDGWGKTR